MNHFGIPYQGEATQCLMMRKVMHVVDSNATKFLHSVSMGLAILCAPSEQKEGKQNRPQALSSNIESLYSFCFRAPMLLMRLTSVA